MVPGEKSLRFKPRTVGDCVIGENAAPGVCSVLTDLIWDPSTRNCLQCRPANIKLIDFSTFPGGHGTPGVVTAAYQVGNIIYGLCGITAGAYAGLDIPFCYNTLTSAFIAVTGISTAKSPTSQATTGAWTPPQMTLTGIKLVVTHVGFDGMTYFFGQFDLTTPTAPVWDAGNTATHGLPSTPQACQQFNNRTYFFCGSTAYYTDTLALAMTNANQSLTVGDYTNVTCAAPLPINSTSSAIIQGILCFKLTKLYLITGDVTTTNLGVNELSDCVGTAAPRSVVPTPEGVRFMTNDGIRNVNFFQTVSEPDDDLALPFIYALTPSRVAAGFSGNIYRICTQNGNAVNTPYQDYWYDFKRRGWTGPHSFRYDLAIPLNNDFVLASNSLIGKMWSSYTVQSHSGTGVTFIENGTQLQWEYTAAPMTDLDNVYANKAGATTIELSTPASGQQYVFTAQDESGSLLATGRIQEPAAQTVWGSFNWGAANWGASQSGLTPITIPWDGTVVFNRLSIKGQGMSSLGLKLGAYRVGYKHLNYLLN